MQLHRNAPRPSGLAAEGARAVWFHRRQLAACAAIVLVAALFVFAAPWLLTLALAERHQTRRRKNLIGLIVLAASARAVLWLWREARRHPLEPPGPWHPCRQCGCAISNRSRARFCSPLCRRLARLQTRADAGDERAASRLGWLTRKNKHDPVWGEVPF
jgi:hypothetical protein